jgi:hypothetical protein
LFSSGAGEKGAVLSHLRKRAELTLAQTHRASLSTCGPADIQTDCFNCTSAGLLLYVEVPYSSDHLFNLESHTAVVVTAPGFHLRGCARLVDAGRSPAGLVVGSGEGAWRALVEIRPVRLQILDENGLIVETIDVEQEASPASTV